MKDFLRLVRFRAAEIIDVLVVGSKGIDRAVVVRACVRVMATRAVVWSERTVLWPKALTVALPVADFELLRGDELPDIERQIAADIADRCAIGDQRPDLRVLLTADSLLTRSLRVEAHAEEPTRPLSPHPVRREDPLEGFGEALREEGGEWDAYEGPTRKLINEQWCLEELQIRHIGGPLIAVSDSVTVGRALTNDERLDDQQASAHHCRFTRNGRDLGVADLGSRNGTWVNDVRVDSATLSHGDHVRVGAARFVVTSGGARDGLTVTDDHAAPSSASSSTEASWDVLSDVELGTVLLAAWDAVAQCVISLEESARFRWIEELTGMPRKALHFSRTVRNRWAHPHAQGPPPRDDLLSAAAIASQVRALLVELA